MMAIHSSTLAWKIPWMEKPGRLQTMGSLRVRHDWATSLSLFTFMHWRRKWQPTHSSVLAWRIPGMEEPGGLPSMGSHRVRHDGSDLAAAAAVKNYHFIIPVTLLLWELFYYLPNIFCKLYPDIIIHTFIHPYGWENGSFRHCKL